MLIVDDMNTKYSQGPFLKKNINYVISKYIKTKDNYIRDLQHGIRDYIRQQYEISQQEKNEIDKEISTEIVKETLYDMLLNFKTLPQNMLFKDFDIDGHIQRNLNKHGYYGYDLKKMRKTQIGRAHV